MNIFFTRSDPELAAEDHCKVHTRKMIIEYAQMLSTAHRILDGDEWPDETGMYKVTHPNHPCTKWVRENQRHYSWLSRCLYRLCEIYKEATGKDHATSRLLGVLLYPPLNLSTGEFIDPPQAMPDEYKSPSTEEAYRAYIKSKFKEWQSRDKPIKVDWYVRVPFWYKEVIKNGT